MTVREENTRAGTKAWWQVKHAPAGAIEGYTTQTSALPGGRIEFCVSTAPVARYRITVFRLGWYGGAGGREVHRTAGNIGLAREVPQPDDATGYNRAGWPVTDVFVVPRDAVSGQWVAHLELTGGPHAGTVALVPFVVRPAPGAEPAVLVQTPVNTLQAYNHWGGKCLYTSNSTDGVAAVKVSFDRPVPAWKGSNLNAKAPFHYDLPLIRWLEREGYDVGYQTDVDTHRAPWSLVGPRLLVTCGHDEYWTLEMRDAFDAACARGTSLAFMGANLCYWQARYEDDERTLVEYRSWSADPEPDERRKTVKWRDLGPGKAERLLIGVQYTAGITHPTRLFDYAVDPAAASHPWGRAAGLDDLTPVPAVVGYEWDGLDAGDPPPGLTRFLTYDGELGNASCVTWTADSGARIFAAGSLGLPFALDDWTRGQGTDPRVQRLVRAAFDDMLG
jgi:hypothetical protein